MYCSNCNIEWSTVNQYCQKCGRRLQRNQPNTIHTRLSCVHCQAPVAYDDIFCGNCGNQRFVTESFESLNANFSTQLQQVKQSIVDSGHSQNAIISLLFSGTINSWLWRFFLFMVATMLFIFFITIFNHFTYGGA